MKFDVVCFGSAVVDAFIITDISEKKGFYELSCWWKNINQRFEI